MRLLSQLGYVRDFSCTSNTPPVSDLSEALERARGGGPARHHEKSQQQGKLPVRQRVARLVDEGTFAEDALLASWEAAGFGADGVVTGTAAIAGRPVCLMANDPTVKAGSWGPKTVEKIIRIQEQALKQRLPMVYLVDSAGARITEQVQMFRRCVCCSVRAPPAAPTSRRSATS
jgi:propionyl-CoA carboxylase beta subunit